MHQQLRQTKQIAAKFAKALCPRTKSPPPRAPHIISSHPQHYAHQLHQIYSKLPEKSLLYHLGKTTAKSSFNPIYTTLNAFPNLSHYHEITEKAQNQSQKGIALASVWHENTSDWTIKNNENFQFFVPLEYNSTFLDRLPTEHSEYDYVTSRKNSIYEIERKVSLDSIETLKSEITYVSQNDAAFNSTSL